MLLFAKILTASLQVVHVANLVDVMFQRERSKSLLHFHVSHAWRRKQKQRDVEIPSVLVVHVVVELEPAPVLEYHLKKKLLPIPLLLNPSAQTVLAMSVAAANVLCVLATRALVANAAVRLRP